MVSCRECAYKFPLTQKYCPCEIESFFFSAAVVSLRELHFGYMMASSASLITSEEFKVFHSIDRQLYTILVINLLRDPLESMQIMALWLWLERLGNDDLVTKILSLPLILINELQEEAIICLNCIHSTQVAPFDSNDIALMQSLMDKEISLTFFLENRLTAISGLNKIMNDICIKVLSDIMRQAIERNTAQSLPESQMTVATAVQQALRPGGQGLLPLFPPRAPGTEVPPDDRTMFVTFSKGYPVHEMEVRDFFTRAFGDCIESLHMQDVAPDEQALFARIVFHQASAMDLILRGLGKVKFSINGKHVWARKFVPRRQRSSLLPPLPPSPSHRPYP